MDWLKQLVSSETFLFFFAVIGVPMIVMGTIQITKLLIKHRERMAMIEHGMDPNAHEPRKRGFKCSSNHDSSSSVAESSPQAAATDPPR